MGNGLIIFGIFWMSVTSLLALRLGLQHHPHVHLLKRLMKQNEYEEFENHRSEWEWRKAVHGHQMLMSLVAIVIGLIVPHMTNSSGLYIYIMGTLLMLAPILWGIFGTWYFQPLLGLGDIFFGIGIIMSGIAYVKTVL